jgi:hypothetical protein
MDNTRLSRKHAIYAEARSGTCDPGPPSLALLMLARDSRLLRSRASDLRAPVRDTGELTGASRVSRRDTTRRRVLRCV